MRRTEFTPPSHEIIEGLLGKVAASGRLSGEDLDTLIRYINLLRSGGGSNLSPITTSPR